MPIADGITVGNPASFSSIESQITNGPPLSSTNAVAYNGKLWMVGGVSTVQDVTIKTYTDVVSTQFQNVLYHYTQAKRYQMCISENTRAHFNTPGANFDTEKISEINTGYETNYNAYIADTADAQSQYQLHKTNGDESTEFTYQTTHTLAVSSDGYTWTRVDQNPFALVSYQINAPQTLEHTSCVNGLAWNGSLWLAIGDGGTANNIVVLNTVISPISGIASNYNATNQLATSPDGITWTVRGRPGRMFSGLAGSYGGGQPYGVAASSSMFMVVVGNLSGIHNYNTGYNTIYDPFYDDVCTICKSTDGINWSKVGNSGDYITQESKWTGYDAVGGLFQGYSVAYNGAYWVAVGAGLPDPGSSYTNVLTGTLRSCIVVSSDDGATWTQGLNNYVGPDPDNASLKNYYNVFSVAWNGSYWLAVGQIANDSHYIPSNFGQIGGKYYYAGDNKGVIITSTDSLDWTVTTGFPVFTTVAWDGNYWIASGQIGIDYNDGNKPIGVTKRSRDGVNWELLSLSGNAIATKIPLPILGGTVNTVSSLIVGFGSPMSILRSFDDETWHPQLTDGYGNNFSGSIQKEFRQVIWTGSSWVVVGKPQYGRNGQTILTSPDALSWAYPSNDLEYGRGVAWNGTMAVAVGSGATTQVTTSTDLTTWTNQTQDTILECNCVAWNGSMWVIGGNGGLNFSTDGTTWIRAVKCPLNIVNGLAWNGYTWLAVGTGPMCTIAISTDGMHWYPVKSDPFSVECSQVAWNGNLWVAVGSSNNSIATSFDGYNWVGQGTSIFDIDGTSISWTGTLWIATGSGRIPIASSPDAITWTPFDIQLIHGSSYANKTITLPYTVYSPSDETVGLVDAVVTIISDLTTADAIAEAEALAIFQNEVATAAATAAALAARNATKANADTFRTRLLYWKSVITQQYSPLLDKTHVNLGAIASTEFLDVSGVYSTVNANVDIMESYYSVIYDDTNTQDSINATLNSLVDLVEHIESIIGSFYSNLAYLYTELTNGTYDSRDPSNMVYIITHWGFPEITKNVVLTAYNNGITAYNSAKSIALGIFDTPIESIIYTDPSSSNAPDFSGAYATLEIGANTVIVMNTVFNVSIPYKTQADAYYEQAKSNVIGWALIAGAESIPDTAAVDAAFAPYYKQYFYSPSYEPIDNPPEFPPSIYILDKGKLVTTYTDVDTITTRTVDLMSVGVKYFKVKYTEFSHPGAYPSVLATLYTQMKAFFDDVNSKKNTAVAYAINLRNTTIKDKLADFLDTTRTIYTKSLKVDKLITDILSVSVYAKSPYESATQLALIVKAGSLLYPAMFPLLLGVYTADVEAEEDGCLPPLTGWGSATNGLARNEIGAPGLNGWEKYNNTYWARNKLAGNISLNTIPGSTAVFNSAWTNSETFLQNYYMLYEKAISWQEFLEFMNGANYQTVGAAYEGFKATITEFEANELFNTATADSYAIDDLADIESQYIPAAAAYIKTLAAGVRKNIPSSNDLLNFGYLPFQAGGITFSDKVDTIDSDFASLKTLANANMNLYTHSQLKNAVTTAKGLVDDINTIQGSSRYKEIMAGIPIYNTVRTNAYNYKNLLQKRVDRWINMKKNALRQLAGFNLGQLNGSNGDGKDSIMSIPPSNSIYWTQRKFTTFGNIDSGKIEECYYNVETETIMALPEFNNTGAAGVYRGRAVYYSDVTYSSSNPPTTGNINYSSSDFSTDGILFLSNAPGSGDIQYPTSVRLFLLQLTVKPTPIVGYLRIYSTTSTLNYAILQIESGVNTVGGVKLICTSIDSFGTLNTGSPVYVAFSTNIGDFDSINYSPEFTLYSPTDEYIKDSRVKDENGVVYQCIKDNTNLITSGINKQPPPLYPNKWRRRTYPYVIYYGQSIEADPANITMLTPETTSPFNNELSYSQGDCVSTLNDSGDIVYYCCINDIDTTGYIIGINPSNSNYWTPRTYQTGKVKGTYVELNPANYPAFNALSVSPYSKSAVYSNQDYISYKKSVYRLTIAGGATQTGLDPSPENGWALVPTMVPAYSDIQIYQREDYVSYNNAVYCLIVGVGVTKQGFTPGSSPWLLVTNPVAFIGTTQQVIQITTVTCPPLQASNFNQYLDTYDRPKTIVTGGAVYTSEFVYETVFKQYVNNNFVSYNGAVYECLYSIGGLIGVPLTHDYFWKKVTYPMVLYNDVLTEAFPGNIPPYEYTVNYTSANSKPLTPSFDFLLYNDVDVYKNGDLVQYDSTPSREDLATAMAELSPETDISSYTTAEQLLIFMRTLFPDFCKGIVSGGFYECVDDSISDVPIVNIPLTNTTYWKQIQYQLIEHKTAGVIPADPSILVDLDNNQSGSLFKEADELDYHEYDNNWIYRVGDLASFEGNVYECTNCIPPNLPSVVRNITPGSNPDVWQDLSSVGTTYDEIVAPIYSANNITPWLPFTSYITGTTTITNGSVTNPVIVNGGTNNTNGTLVTIDNDLGARAAASVGFIRNTVRYFTNKRTTCQIITDDVYDLTVGQYVRFLITSGGRDTTIYKDGNQELFEVTEVSAESFKVTASGGLLSDITGDDIEWQTTVGGIENIAVVCSGKGYTNPPTVVITGDGTNAEATAIISDGYVVRIDIINPGSGYTTNPIVTFKICETTATLNPPTIVNGVVTNVTIASGGTGYTSAPLLSGNDLQTVNGKQYLKNSFVMWCGDIYKCELDITYQSTYNLNTTADITALQNSVPSLNPLYWTLITDYTIFTPPIPPKYDPTKAYAIDEMVTLRTVTDSTTVQAIRSFSFFDVVDYTLSIYKCISAPEEMTYGVMVGISPLESTGYWKDISSGGTDYDSYVVPLYAANNITKWWPFNTASYTKGSIVTWDGDFYKCETPVTYQTDYNLYIPAHVIALKNSTPPNNPTVWSLITDYSIFTTPIPNKYDPKVTYLETDEVTIKTVLDPSTVEASSASAFFGLDVYHTLTFYECISTDPSYPVKYTYDEFSAVEPTGTDTQGNTTYKFGITYGTYQDSDQPRYIPKNKDPFGLPNFAHIIRRNVAMDIELPYKYAKTHVEAARRGDIETITTLIAGATRLKYNFAALSVKPAIATTEFNTFLNDIDTIINTFDSSESVDDINYIVKNAYISILQFLRTWRRDMMYFVNQVNKIKTQYFNLPSVQAAIYKNPYKYLNPVALATNITTPGHVKIMFRDLGIGDIDEITYNLDVLHNHILSTEAERTYYNKNVVIITNYINSINEHINAAKDLIGFSVLTLAVSSTTKAGVRIYCRVPKVDNVGPIYIDTPITDFNGLDNYTEQRNFNENVIGDRNILGTCTYQELETFVAYNTEGDTYYVQNYAINYDDLSPQDKAKFDATNNHLFVFKPDANKDVLGYYSLAGWLDLGYFDDPLVDSTITGYINAMVLESVRPPNYTLPTSKESATALALTYESTNQDMRNLTMFTRGVVGTVAAGFQNIWDPMAILGLVNLISGQTLLEGGGLTFPNFNDRAESITLLNQLVAIEIGKKQSLKRGIVAFGVSSGTTTSFQLGLTGMVKNACYNIGLFNSSGAQREGLSVTYADRAEFTILSIANQNINPGYISFTNGTTASGTITISIYDRNLTDVSSFSSMLYSSPATIKGYIVIYSVSTPSIFSVFSITGGSSTGSGTISAASLTCTFIRSSGTGSLGENPNNVGVVFSKNLPSETAIYGSTLLTNNGKDLKLSIPSGSGTGAIYGAKVITGAVPNGGYTLKYKLSTEGDYHSFIPSLTYNATTGTGWSAVESQYVTPTDTSTTQGSEIHSLSDLDAGLTTVGKLLLLNSIYRHNLVETLEYKQVYVERGKRTLIVDLPPQVSPPNALNLPTNKVVIPPKPELQLEKSIQRVIDKLEKQARKLEKLADKIRAEMAVIQGLPVKVNAIRVDIPSLEYDIIKPPVKPSSNPPKSVYYSDIDKKLISAKKVTLGGNDNNPELVKFKESLASKHWQSITPSGSGQAVSDTVEEFVETKVPNNLEEVNKAIAENAKLEQEAIEATKDAERIKTSKLGDEAAKLDANTKKLDEIKSSIARNILEENARKIRNSQKTADFERAELAYNKAKDASKQADEDIAEKKAAYEESVKKYKKMKALNVTRREQAIQKALVKAKQVEVGKSFRHKITVDGKLKITFKEFELRMSEHPVVKESLRGKFFRYFRTAFEYTFDDLFDSVKKLGRQGNTARSFVQSVVRANIGQLDVDRANARLKNTKAVTLMESRGAALAKTGSTSLTKALTKGASKAATATGRAIMRAPILGLAGIGMEIYGAVMTAMANGAYESNPTILGS